MKYLSNEDVPVSEFLESCQICSEAIGREKRNSASKDVFVELAKFTNNFMRQMSDNALLNCPSLERFTYPSGNKFPENIPEK